MQKESAAAALKIGRTVRDARLDAGYDTRASFLDTVKMKKKLTEEGLRKIEAGDRVPRLETLRRLCGALGLSTPTCKNLEELALRTNLERAAVQAGNGGCVVQVRGKVISARPAQAQPQQEEFVRKSVDEIMEVVGQMGGFATPDMKSYFRRHTRRVLLSNLNA